MSNSSPPLCMAASAWPGRHRCGNVALAAALLALLAPILGGTGAAPLAKGKKGGKKPLAQVAMHNALVSKGDAVQDCAKNALEVKNGARRVEISTKVTVSGRGQIIDVRTDVKVDVGDAKPVRDCVDALIRAIKFPPSEAPLVTIERSWTIAG